jgi:hypothetical protein
LAKLETVTAMAELIRVGNGPVVQRDVNVDFPMGLCDVCQARRARATAILDAHERLTHSLGSRFYSENAMDAALIVFDASRLVWKDLLTASDRDVRLALDSLPAAGASVRWSARFAPVKHLGAEPNTAGDARWSHLTGEQQTTLSDAYGALLFAASDTPVPTPPPARANGREALNGCLLCGIGMIPARRSMNAWGPLRRGNDSTLGGRGRSEPHHGYLCPVCRRSMDKHACQALGMNALQWAFFDHLGVVPRQFDEDVYGRTTAELRGLQAWCTLPDGTPPNATPWAHVPAQARLREALEAA